MPYCIGGPAKRDMEGKVAKDFSQRESSLLRIRRKGKMHGILRREEEKGAAGRDTLLGLLRNEAFERVAKKGRGTASDYS